MRELTSVELDQISGGCDNCSDPGMCGCLPDVPTPPIFSCTLPLAGSPAEFINPPAPLCP